MKENPKRINEFNLLQALKNDKPVFSFDLQDKTQTVKENFETALAFSAKTHCLVFAMDAAYWNHVIHVDADLITWIDPATRFEALHGGIITTLLGDHFMLFTDSFLPKEQRILGPGKLDVYLLKKQLFKTFFKTALMLAR